MRWACGLVVAAVALLSVLTVTAAADSGSPPTGKIGICHHTGESQAHEWVFIEPDASGVLDGHGQLGHQFEEDVIPAFTLVDSHGDTHSFAGLNLTTRYGASLEPDPNGQFVGADLLAAGCAGRPATPTLTTSASDTQIEGSISDTATLSDVPANAGGTLTFTAYGPRALNSTTPDCSGTAAFTSAAIPVSGPGDYNSGAFTPTAVGKYDWKVHYSGSGPGLVLAADSECGAMTIKEVSSVTPKNPTVTTDAGSTVTLTAGNASLSDKATLAGGTSDISGTITFHLYSDPSCNSEVTGSPVASTVSANGLYTSTAIVVHAAGTYHWIANYGGDAKNTATSNGCNADNENVRVANPGLTITKGPEDQTIVSGTTATFNITVTNTADDTLTNVHVTDTQAPGCARTAAQIAADPNAPHAGTATFNKNDTYSYTCTLDNVTASFTNSATATGTPPEGPDVTDTDTANVHVINPAITVTKNPDEQIIRTGSTATFSITVKNTGDATLTNVHVTDALAPGCARTAAEIAGGRGSSTFAPNDSYTYQCTKGNVTAGFTNSATATGTPAAGPDVTATDTAHVTVISPAISIAKSPDSQTVDSGSTATFTIVVTNTGDSTLTNVNVTDPLTSSCAHTIGTLAAGASTTYTCTTSALTAGFTNTATATGTPPVGPDVTASDTAAVSVNPPPTPPAPTPPTPSTPAPVVVHPAITIVKDPKTQTVASGGTATFTITVTNTGDVDLNNVTITDALAPGCARSLGTLLKGTNVQYTCTQTGITAAETNVAIATGTAAGQTVTAQDTAAVKVAALKPAAKVVKKVVKPKAKPKPKVHVKPKVVSHHMPKNTG